MRTKLAAEWRRTSTELYYYDLLRRVRDEKSIYFPDLLPPSAERLLSHYRFSPSGVIAGQSFLEVLSNGSQALLTEEGLGTTIHRLAGFPAPLPSAVFETLDNLSDEEVDDLSRRLLKAAGSPVSRMHQIRILTHLGRRKKSYYRLARRCTKDLFTKSAIEEFGAFVTVLRWVNHEIGYWQEASEWRPAIRLAMVWAHAHQLISIMMAVGVPTDWITETFTLAINGMPRDLFDNEPEYWLDVTHPDRCDWLLFTLMGLAYGAGENPEEIIDRSLSDLLTLVAFQEFEGVVLPASSLWRDNSRASDSLGSFLGGSYDQKLAMLFGEERAQVFGNPAFAGLARNALDELINEPKSLPAWRLLITTISDLPAYNTLVDDMATVFQDTQFNDLFEHSVDSWLPILDFVASQVAYLADEDLQQHIKDEFTRSVEYLSRLDWETINQQDEATNLATICRSLLQIALTIARYSGNSDEAVIEFQELIARLVESWPATAPLVRSIVQIMCEELPIQQAKYFVALFARLRAM